MNPQEQVITRDSSAKPRRLKVGYKPLKSRSDALVRCAGSNHAVRRVSITGGHCAPPRPCMFV